MKKILYILTFISVIAISCDRDKPDIFEQEAKLKIENTSSSNNITGVYFGTVGPGTNNRISSNIGPGESKTFTISADFDEDNIYDIKITCDNTDIGDFEVTHHEFWWNDIYIIELTDSGWYDDDTW